MPGVAGAIDEIFGMKTKKGDVAGKDGGTEAGEEKKVKGSKTGGSKEESKGKKRSREEKEGKEKVKEKKEKKEKKDKKKKEEAASDATNGSVKKSKKAKSVEGADGADPSPAAVNGVEDAAMESADALSQDPLHVDNFEMSAEVKQRLKEKGIEALFPIQAQTFQDVVNGHDLVARARTGQGKTLAFVLPIIQSLSAGRAKSSAAYGRAPSVLVLAPTRELAKQVGEDFEFIGKAVGMSCCCVYGGAPMGPQDAALRRGVDVVVGTPGRVKDLMQRGTLKLQTIRFRVLDEADEMLNMGFVDDVETILGAVSDPSAVQTLLFSATLPDWVKQISERFFRPSKKTVDLVGDQKLKASGNVRHMLLPCHWSQRTQIVSDIVSCYASNGLVIIFTETKSDAGEVAQSLSHLSARALHGDIPQAQRETTLAAFRQRKFTILVATDVAARGLDISDVRLVVQCEPPKSAETYIHRSGRTGRAGNKGVSVLLVAPKKEYLINIIERSAGFRFERISAPQPSDIARSAAAAAVEAVVEVNDSVIPHFREAAQNLLDSAGIPAADLLAKALAKIAGHTDIKRRSLLSSHDDSVTLLFKSPTAIRSPSFVFAFLRRCLPGDLPDTVRRMTLTADSMGAAFDVKKENLDQFLQACKGDAESELTLELAESLPALQVREERDLSNGYGSNRGSYGGNSSGYGKSYGGRGGGRGQRSSGRGFSRGGGRRGR